MIAPARAAAFAALQQISSADVTLGEALARMRPRVEDERDRALVNEIVTGTLRHQRSLDYQLAQRIARPFARLDADVVISLRLSAFQLLHLQRVPAPAIVNDAVSLVRAAGKSSASGLVNAVLRRLARERGSLTWPARPRTIESDEDRAELIEHLSVVHSHPAWLLERWLGRYGDAATEQWLAFNNEPAPLTIAANTAQITREALTAALADEGVATRPTERAANGLIVTAGQVLRSQAFRDGLCLMQDEASQLVSEMVPVPPGGRILDACASPGGKTVALAARAAAGGLVIATDVRARRVRTLRETLARCAVRNVRVVHIDPDGPLPFAPGIFASVLVDAPCSGLGTLRRDPDIRWRRQPDDFPRFAEGQLRLLARVAPLVAPGGHLVYSTCSSEPDENEEVVERFLAGTARFALQPPILRTFPFRDRLEAFFAAVMQAAVVR